jgi:hypothetical protein
MLAIITFDTRPFVAVRDDFIEQKGWSPRKRGGQRKTPVVDINRGSLFRPATPYQKLAGTESACGDDAGVALRPETSLSPDLQVLLDRKE